MRLVFDIDPVPASRPRVTKWRTYYGAKYKQFKADMEKLLMGKGKNPIAEPIRTDVTFWLPIPKSYPKKRQEELRGKHCVGNADIDNYEKALYDSLNGILFIDDKQIVEHSTRKMWADIGKIELNIETL